MKNIRIFWVWGIVLGMVVMGGCDRSDQKKLSREEINTTLKSIGFQVYKEPVPVEEQLLKLVQIESDQPSIRLINFWATWCMPCRQEIPALQKLEQKIAGESFQLITINLDENSAVADKFIKKKKIDFLVIKDISQIISKKFGVRQLPTAFLLDKQNRVLGTVIGAVEWNEKETLSFMKRLSQSVLN